MAEALEAVMDRVRKLLALSKSDNEHEAATAIAAAQKLLTKHGLEMADVPADDPLVWGVVADGGRLWISVLAEAVATANQCRAITSRVRISGRTRTQISFCGRRSDMTKARFLLEYYIRETNRLCGIHGARRGRTWANNFCHGVVDALEAALQRAVDQAARETSNGGITALIRLDARGDEAEELLHKLHPGARTKAFAFRSDESARATGREAGKTIAPSSASAAIEGGGHV